MTPARVTRVMLLEAPPPSAQEAATRLQAHWRGRVVRRTRPLEKLRAISQVRQDLRGHLQALGGPTGQFEKLCFDPKERLRWSECAMELLLRLDAVQGAPAEVREVRKLVTKEVIAFQEIIDSTSKDASSGTNIVKPSELMVSSSVVEQVICVVSFVAILFSF